MRARGVCISPPRFAYLNARRIERELAENRLMAGEDVYARIRIWIFV